MYSIPYVRENTSAYNSSTYLVIAYGERGFPITSSTLGRLFESPYVDELAANMKRLTPASRAAIIIFKKPPTLTSLVVAGSLIDLGTDPNAASCNTMSILSTAFRQSSIFRISPTINVKFGYDSIRGIIFSILPVAKLSKHTTLSPRFKKASHKFEPINPAPPVINTFFI